MTKWIRWSGLAGFVAVVALLVVFMLFALGPIIKISIETFGSQAVGAKVDVEDVSVSFSPLALTITGVQVADKESPMENVVSSDQALANLNVLPLFLGKAIVPDLSLQGVVLGSSRTVSGALSEKAKEETKVEEKSAKQASTQESSQTSDADAAAEEQSKALPSADEILERETLLTVTEGEAFKTSFDEHKTSLDSALSNLPNDNALKTYETKLNGLLKGKFKNLDDFKQRKKELDTLQAQFKKDKAAIKQAKSAIKNAKSDLKTKFSALKKAPKQDLDNLKGKYTLDGAGASNLAALLFGDDAGPMAEKALGYYEKVRPLLVDEEASADKQAAQDKRLEGRFVHFETDRPLPELWVQNLNFTMTLPAIASAESLGVIAVTVTDITHQPEVIGKPIKIKAQGLNLKNMKSLDLNGVLDHRTSPGRDAFDLKINGWELSEVKLGLAGLKLASSETQVLAKAVLVDGDLNVNSETLFSKAKFVTKDRTVFAKEMLGALKNINRFTVNANAQGEMTDPSVSIKSDLDKQLKSAFDKRIGEKQAQLEKDLKNKLNKKLLSYAGDYEAELKQLNLAEGGLSSKTKALEKLGKSKISSYEDQLKAEAKAKADAKKAKAKAQADAKKAKAKADADKKKKELERKAKEKFKKLF